MKKTEIIKIGFLILTLVMFLGLFENTKTESQTALSDDGGTGVQRRVFIPKTDFV